MSRFVTITTFLLLAFFSQSQLVTSPGAPGSLVQDVLLGSGVTVSNITFNGSPAAIGSFTASNSNLGLTNGIVMTTGTINNVNINGKPAGPHGPNNVDDAGFNNNYGGYGLLSQIVGGATTYNAAVLEFDFVPYSDTVQFRYVFGSEEYPEYVGSEFNDVFAFFISGPGISGNQNIAKIPGTNTPVAINNVHGSVSNNFGTFPAQNGAYYVNNAGGSTIQYDGFTTVLEAVSRVQCGETYHLRIAIADVGDGIYDSGIFLEANSLTSKTPVEVDYELSQTLFEDPNTMAEGCVSTTVTLSRETNLNEAITIPINVAGTATEGVDYSSIPNQVNFQPGQSEIEFTIDSYEDGITEGLENIQLEFMITDPCGTITPLYIELSIQDAEPMTLSVDDVTVTCPGDEVELNALLEGGVGPFTYEWSTTETSESIMVSPTSTQSYQLTVHDECTGDEVSTSATVYVPVFDPIQVTATDDIVEICPYIPTTLQAQATGGSGNYIYQWSSNHDGILGSQSSQYVNPSETTIYTVQVIDQCGNHTSTTTTYTITSPPLVVDISPIQQICPGDSIQITASPSGGYGQYYYFWPHSQETTSSVWVQPGATTNYQVVVSDECQTFSVPAVTTVEVIKPTADFAISSSTLFNGLPVTFQNLTVGGDTYYWDFGDFSNSEDVHPNHTYVNYGDFWVTLIATNELGCKDTIIKPIKILEEYYIYVPNTFTPDHSGINDYFKVSTVGISTLDIKVFNRWGELIFQSDDLRFLWDGTYNNAPVQDGTYTYIIEFLANNGIDGKLTGHINVAR